MVADWKSRTNTVFTITDISPEEVLAGSVLLLVALAGVQVVFGIPTITGILSLVWLVYGGWLVKRFWELRESSRGASQETNRFWEPRTILTVGLGGGLVAIGFASLVWGELLGAVVGVVIPAVLLRQYDHEQEVKWLLAGCGYLCLMGVIGLGAIAEHSGSAGGSLFWLLLFGLVVRWWTTDDPQGWLRRVYETIVPAHWREHISEELTQPATPRQSVDRRPDQSHDQRPKHNHTPEHNQQSQESSERFEKLVQHHA